MILRRFIWAGLAFALLTMILFWRLLDHDLDGRRHERFHFDASDTAMAGSLWLPDSAPRAAVALVHGDGPQNRTSGGGYAPLINRLLDKGIAVASWDKAGTGASRGNWLDQSMAARADETRAALKQLSQRFEGLAIGALGFSQAGWVLPRLSKDDADFLVLVGPAVSWQAQGDYYTRMRLSLSGMNDREIERSLARVALADDRAFVPDVRPSDAPAGMGLDRWGFIRKNRQEDARADLDQLDIPLLAIWGAKDLNVDAVTDAAIYRAGVATRHPDNDIVVWPDATHGLLKAGPYNWQSVDHWPWYAKLRFLVEGRHAYAAGSIERVSAWILERGGLNER